MTLRKFTRCQWIECGRPLPAIASNGSRRGQPYKCCSPECNRAYLKDYWHRWYVANVKATKAARRAGLSAAGFRPIERRRCPAR
jgi:hypothetical protein